jgi:carbamoyl-phosphate synthase small subunit
VNIMKKNALIALADGTVFWGHSFGAEGGFAGELVFNTAQTGYQEILSDPSYAGQVLVFTSPHIGVVGVNSKDEESEKIWASGMITRSISLHKSNWRADTTLPEYLIKQGRVGITDIDTRALTHLLREKGSQNAYIMAGSPDPKKAVQKARMFSGLHGLNLTKMVSTLHSYTIPCNAEQRRRVVVMDFGVKQSILNHLHKISCELIVVPASSSVETILSYHPDGVFLSNGPGDPSACKSEISVIHELLNLDIPIFGICLGHQLLALASGAKTEKMLFGHHGANHPIIDVRTKNVFISSQNHGFMVSDASLPSCIEVTHRSLFDRSIAAIKRKDKLAFSFQGHPEASPGPHDLHFLFQNFYSMMDVCHAKAL